MRSIYAGNDWCMQNGFKNGYTDNLKLKNADVEANQVADFMAKIASTKGTLATWQNARLLV